MTSLQMMRGRKRPSHDLASEQHPLQHVEGLQPSPESRTKNDLLVSTSMSSGKAAQHYIGMLPMKKRKKLTRPNLPSSHCVGIERSGRMFASHGLVSLKQGRAAQESPANYCASMSRKSITTTRCETSTSPNASTISPTVTTAASFNDLPLELFTHVLSYLGPTTKSLTRIASLNRYHATTMRTIGDAMLRRARSHFRVPLPPLGITESSTSQFVRHARACKGVYDKLVRLNLILDKDFVILPNDGTRAAEISPSSSSTAQSKTKSTVTSREIDTALDIALDLLGVTASKSESLMAGVHTSLCSTALEFRVLALCGRCGGKVFKHMKARLLSLNNRAPEENRVRRTGANSNSFGEGNGATTADGRRILSPAADGRRQAQFDMQKLADEKRLDKSRLIMQLVVFRDLQIARESSSRTKVPIVENESSWNERSGNVVVSDDELLPSTVPPTRGGNFHAGIAGVKLTNEKAQQQEILLSLNVPSTETTLEQQQQQQHPQQPAIENGFYYQDCRLPGALLVGASFLLQSRLQRNIATGAS